MSNGQKIKLLIFVPNLECGGSEKYISLLCDHIDTDQFDVTLVVLDNEHPFYEINNPLINIIGLQVKRVSRSLSKIKKIIAQQQPAIILTAANHLNLLFAIFKRRLAKDIPIIARESSIVSINNRRAKFPVLYNWLVKRFYNRFDHIICQSEYMQQDLIEHFNISPDKTTVIYNAVEEMQSNVVSTTHKGVYKFITVARLSAEKGIDRLIKAVAKFPQSCHYYIIGEGEQRQQLQALIDAMNLGEQVFLTGEKIHPWLHMEDADVFLSGSHHEGFPNALLEAGAMGIPVVAYDVPGGISEIINNEENGLLVKDNDEGAFVAAIEKSLELKFDRNAIITATKKRFSIAVNLQAIEGVLQQIWTDKNK